MAIITDYIDDRNYTYPEQYVNISAVILFKENMEVQYGVYFNEQSRLNGTAPHTVDRIVDIPFDIYSGTNIWEQAYAALKARYPNSKDA